MLMLGSGTSWDPEIDFSKTFGAAERVLSHSSMNPSSKSLWPSLGMYLGFTLIVFPSVVEGLLANSII